MKLVVHAANIHQGGGRSLLVALLSALRQVCVVLLDERLAQLPDMDPQVHVIRVAPTIFARLKAEYRLKAICEKGDTLLCFGNLPPLFSSPANVFVYLQNRYLTSSSSLNGFGWTAQMRIRFERFWLRFCLRDSRILVQTETTAAEVRNILGVECFILPFVPDPSASVNSKANQRLVYDYLYIASGEPHKNHHRLVEAWIILAERDCRPSLCLTLDRVREEALCSWIDEQVGQYGLHIITKPGNSDQMAILYAQSSVLIYPSLFESFGLPLLEARQVGLPIIAAERDYVRDVVEPVESFDPESSSSIARAVLRHRGLIAEPNLPASAEFFLRQLSEL